MKIILLIEIIHKKYWLFACEQVTNKQISEFGKIRNTANKEIKIPHSTKKNETK